MVVAGLQLGNVFVTVQPLLGVEGDPMRLLFERDLTPHPQYCEAYEWMRMPEERGGAGSKAVVHLGVSFAAICAPRRGSATDDDKRRTYKWGRRQK